MYLTHALNLALNAQPWSPSVHMGSSTIDLVKSLSISCGILLEELQNISKAIGQKIGDLTDSQLDLIRSRMIGADAKSFGMRMGGGKLSGGALNSLEVFD